METGNSYSYNSVTLLQNPNIIKDIMGYITTVSEDRYTNYTYMGVRERARPHTHICELNGVQQKLPPLFFTSLYYYIPPYSHTHSREVEASHFSEPCT